MTSGGISRVRGRKANLVSDLIRSSRGGGVTVCGVCAPLSYDPSEMVGGAKAYKLETEVSDYAATVSNPVVFRLRARNSTRL